ncbi:MAG: MFS transporter [Sphingomonas fennica]
MASAAAAPAADAPYPPRRQAWYTIWLIAAVTMLSNVDRSIINLLVQPIKRDLVLSDTEISLIIGTAFSLFYMLVGLPMARVSDVRNRKVILAGGLTVWSLATAVCGAAQSFAALFVARGVVGGAESVAGPASMSLISDIVPREKLPRAFAVYQLGISAGQAVALFAGGAMLAYFVRVGPLDVPLLGLAREWQLTFLTCAIPGLLLAVIFFLTVREPVRRNRRVVGAVPIREVLAYLGQHRALYVPLLLSIAIGSIETVGLQTWRPAFYERTYGWGPAQIGPLLALSLLVSTPIAITSGTWLAEYVARKGYPDAMVRTCVITQVLAIPFVIATPLMPNPWAALMCGTTASTFGLMSAPAQNSAIQLVTPNEMRAQVSALYLFTISAVGTSLGPLVVALVTDLLLQDESLLRYSMSGFAAVVAPIGALLMWLAMRPYGRAAAAAA